MTARRSAASKSRRCTARVCMAVSNTRTPARPAVLAAYMAMSASRSSRSGSSSPPRASRTPTLARASTSRPDTVTGLRRMAAIRSPRTTASPSSATSGTSTANSSPPSRAARSPGPRQPRSRSATTRRTSSPEEWPRLSLIVLKSSRSSRSRAGAAGPAPLEGAKRLLQPPGERRPVGQPGERVDAGPAGHLGGQLGPPQGQGDLGAEALQGVTGLVGDQLGVPGQLGRGVQAEQPGGGLGGHPVDGGGIGRGQQGRPGRGQQPERRL